MKKHVSIKIVLISAAIILLVFSSSVLAQRKSIRQMEDAVSTAFSLSELDKLDTKRLRQGKIKIVIENSIFDIGEKQFETRNFKTFKQAEQWLKSREQEQVFESQKYRTPLRAVGRLTGCRRGICLYDYEGGILHNHLYLEKIIYSYRNGRTYVKTLYLLYG